MSALEIVDLKRAQKEAIYVLKNNVRNRFYVEPINNKGPYFNPNDVITFSLKPHGYDFIDFNSMCLSFEIQVWADGTGITAGPYNNATQFFTFMMGAWSVIRRIELLVGSRTIEDIDNYHVLTTHHVLHNVDEGYTNTWNGWTPDFERANRCFHKGTAPTEAKWCRFKIPIHLCLERGTYLPIYNLAEDLQIRISLENQRRCLRSGFITVSPAPTTQPMYAIRGLRISLEAINAMAGASLTPDVYPFTSSTVTHYTYPWAITSSLFSRPIDARYMSTKKIMALQMYENEWNKGDFTAANSQYWRSETFSSWFRDNIDTYVVRIGGVNFPAQDRVQLPIDMFNNTQIFYHNYDDNTSLKKDWINRDTFWLNPLLVTTDPANFTKFSVCAVLENLPLAENIISGINTEKSNVMLEMSGTVAKAYNTVVLVWVWRDMIISFEEGTINVEQ